MRYESPFKVDSYFTCQHYLITVTSELFFKVIGFKKKGDADIYC